MKYILALLLTLSLLFVDESPHMGAAADGAANAKARTMMRLVAKSPKFQALPQQCPLSIYKTKRNTAGKLGDCAKNPRECMRQCEAGNRVACFRAARVIQKGTLPMENRATYRLFMEGCALGDGNACVNAGASMKNTAWSSGKPAAATSAKCQFTTYKRMCDDGHAWGCYMTAQEYRRNKGYRGKSEKQYQTYMRRACKVRATSGACLDRFK